MDFQNAFDDVDRQRITVADNMNLWNPQQNHSNYEFVLECSIKINQELTDLMLSLVLHKVVLCPPILFVDTIDFFMTHTVNMIINVASQMLLQSLLPQ